MLVNSVRTSGPMGMVLIGVQKNPNVVTLKSAISCVGSRAQANSSFGPSESTSQMAS